MRILSIFFWIIIGAILVYFFTANASQYVSMDLLYTTYENVSLAIVIFLSIFMGVIMGAVLLITQYFKAKAEVVGLRKQNKNLQQKIKKNESNDSPPLFAADLPADNITEKEEE